MCAMTSLLLMATTIMQSIHEMGLGKNSFVAIWLSGRPLNTTTNSSNVLSAQIVTATFAHFVSFVEAQTCPKRTRMPSVCQAV